MYSSHHNKHPPIKKNISIKMMHLSNQGMLLYNNKLYQQIDSVAMGCPLVPTMANFLLGHFKPIMLRKQTSNHPKLYVRCMDNNFAVFENDNACMLFLKVLNNQHENISCMIEKSKNTLQFLDVAVQINDKDVDMLVWRKPTNTSLSINLKAICPLNWKSDLISCMLHHPKMIR